MSLVDDYIAGVKQLRKMRPVNDAELYDATDAQLCELWFDMDDKERAQASAIFYELWPQR